MIKNNKEIIPIVIGFYSSKGGCGKSSLCLTLFYMLLKQKNIRLSNIKIVDSASVTSSITKTFSHSYYDLAYKSILKLKNINSEDFIYLVEKKVQDITNDVIKPINVRDLAILLKQLKNISKALELTGQIKYILIDFDGGALDNETIKMMSDYVDLWIIPCAVTLTAVNANEEILTTLLHGKIKPNKILQIVNVMSQTKYIDETLLKSTRSFVSHSVDKYGVIDFEYELCCEPKLGQSKTTMCDVSYARCSAYGKKNYLTLEKAIELIEGIANKQNQNKEERR